MASIYFSCCPGWEWFIPAIVSFYLLVPLYFRFFKKSKNTVLFTIGAILLWLVLSMVLNIRLDLYGFTNRIPIFLIGILIGWLCKHRKNEWGNGAYVTFFVMFVLGIYLAWQTNMKGMEILVPV